MSPQEDQPQPICFVVMPFGIKPVTGPVIEGAPGELDCDALWERLLKPAIKQLGYLAIRADADPGTLIIHDMFERLALADLVVADVSLPNGNVYYELGLRHVAKETGCVTVAAEWSRQLFDINQFRTVRYPLASGDVPTAEVAPVVAHLAEGIESMRSSKTPYHRVIPDVAGGRRSEVFREHVTRLSAFQAAVAEARLHPPGEVRRDRVKRLREGLPPSALHIGEVATELLCLLRDTVGWQEVLDFVGQLPPSVADLPYVREQRLLAVGKGGDSHEAVVKLKQLVEEFGDSEERQGLIGGRYKRLWRDERERRQGAGESEPTDLERRYLDHAIEHYSAGMQLDFNAYFCSTNLALLLLARDRPAQPGRGVESDRSRARRIELFVIAACRRAMQLKLDDEWTRPTLLGAAFRAGDVVEAAWLADRVAHEGPAAWALETTLDDLRESISLTEGQATRDELHGVYDRLSRLAASGG